MPAIPVYTASPINAATADGQTPQTAQPAQQSSQQQPASVPATTTSAPSQSAGYPAPQPAARPSQPPPPAPTGFAQDQTSLQPTPTQSLPSDGPPAPQPGAVPVAPTSHLPPPPKVGETLQQPPQTTTATVMPPQMSYPAPTSQYAAGKSTSTMPPPQGPMPTSLQAGGGGDLYNHPPGYMQNVHASDMSSAQRAAHEASVRDNSHVFETGDDEGVWGTMKKWGTSVGNNLAAAENEVWKRINKE